MQLIEGPFWAAFCWAATLALVVVCVPVFCWAAIRFLSTVFPGLHPCRRGFHQFDFEHRICVSAFGRGKRGRVGYVEQRTICPRCGQALSGWKAVQGPSPMLESDLTEAENTAVSRGERVYLKPAGGKMWN